MTDTPTLGRAASLRVAYASAMQDVQRLTEENARLKETIVHLQATIERKQRWRGIWHDQAYARDGMLAEAKRERDTAIALCNAADFDTAQHVQLSIGERDAARRRADAAEAEVKRLREVLGFYADAANYRSYWHEGRLPIIEDLGKRALAALAQKEASHD